MKTHADIDRRSLEMARRIVERIDNDPTKKGLEKARSVCEQWSRINPQPCVEEWRRLLGKDWQDIRSVLLDESEKGCEMRQNSPFCGVLRPNERWEVYREFRNHEKRSA